MSINHKEQRPNNDLLLLVCLENNPLRTFQAIYYAAEQEGRTNLLERDDVIPLSDNAIFFDSTIALDMYGQCCLILDQAKVPYMTLHTESSSVKVRGKFSKEVETILKTYEIPLQKTS